MLDLLQWPAMIVTVIAAWFVASSIPARRKVGFWLFLASNALWIAWGVPARAYALVALQICLAFMNIRGERRNSRSLRDDPAARTRVSAGTRNEHRAHER